MSTTLQQPKNGNAVSSILAVVDMPDLPDAIHIDLDVTDADSVRELTNRQKGRERDEYTLCALRIGILSLKHARGQIDADAVKREGDRLLEDLGTSFESYRSQLHENVTAVLKEYFDPNNGRFQERLERLVRKDGDLEQLLRRQIGVDGSELAKTLAAHVGENSPTMNLLDPEESTGLVQAVRNSAEEVLHAEREIILAEFSLDNKEGALNRMILELTEENGRLTGDLTKKVDEVVKEFSLDKEDSALSRLVRKVETAQRTITNEFSLDNDGSALSRMSVLLNHATEAIHSNLTLDVEGSALARLKRELVEILNGHQEQATAFQRDVSSVLDAMKARREESLRSTAHGRRFEEEVAQFIEREAEKAGDVATATGNSTGAIKNCKVGDATVELGPDCVAKGTTFVIEAKEHASYDIAKARAEIETARKNRGASIGVFVFSKKTAPASQEPLLRYGNDIFVVWDAEDMSNDVILKSALCLAKALCVRESKTREAEAADFQAIDCAILAIEKEAKRLDAMKTWTETITSNGGKILEEVRKMTAALERQMQILRNAISGLKHSAIQES
jgi:hemerythrin-like domain-containing protein